MEEIDSSTQKNSVVASKWADLYQADVPQVLFQQTTKQYQTCLEILESKDTLIQEIRNELKHKDNEYVRALKQQAEDLDTLLQYMTQQLHEMQVVYKQELGEIENSFLQVSMHQKVWRTTHKQSNLSIVPLLGKSCPSSRYKNRNRQALRKAKSAGAKLYRALLEHI